MSYGSASQGFSLFPAAPAAPHAFNLFSLSQSPRETHALFEDLMSVLRPAAVVAPRGVLCPTRGREKELRRSRSTPSLRKTWRKLFGLEPDEPNFEIVTPESGLAAPPCEEDAVSSDGSSVGDEEFGVLRRSLSREKFICEGDSTMSGDTLVDEELDNVSDHMLWLSQSNNTHIPFHFPSQTQGETATYNGSIEC